MDLNTVTDVLRPRRRESLAEWRAGDAWLAGGTWLFSEPRPTVDRLVDLDGFDWPPIEIDGQHLTIAATCRIAALAALATPPDWTAAPLIDEMALRLAGATAVCPAGWLTL